MGSPSDTDPNHDPDADRKVDRPTPPHADAHSDEHAPLLVGRRLTRAVLVVDLVESVRLIEEDEHGAVQRWRGFVDQVQRMLPRWSGARLVKSLGDGMMLEFPDARGAASAAFAIGSSAEALSRELPPQQQFQLRMGVHVGELLADDLDIYGRGVNLAARLMTLAGPAEIVVSADVREQITATVDAEIEDLGECHLKHIAQPVRAYRIGPPGPKPVVPGGGSHPPHLLPTVCVIPFTARMASGDQRVLGEVIADEVIHGLSRSIELNVVSRLSTTVFRDRAVSLDDLRTHLQADYVVTGTYQADGDKLQVMVELIEAVEGQVMWSDRLNGSVNEVAWGRDALLDTIVNRVSGCILAREIERTRTNALPTLRSHTLLIAAIALMHRLSRADFEHARVLLQAVIDRAPRQGLPYAWLAKWHVLKVHQGWSEDRAMEERLARDAVQRAIEADAQRSLGLTMKGLVASTFTSRLDEAEAAYDEALLVNPNDSLGWLLKGTLHAFRGEGPSAMACTEKALVLSPLDPMRWYYDSLAATAAISDERYAEAISYATRSLRANRVHTSSWRAMVIAKALSGDVAGSQESAKTLLTLEPGMTVQGWRQRSPTTGYAVGDRIAQAFRVAGIPER